MLENRTTHADYQQFLISNFSLFYKTFPKRIEELESSKSKLYCLDLDILFEILKVYYSNKGIHATLQPEIFRLFSLMLFLKETISTNLVNKLHNDDLLAIYMGCRYGKIPLLGAYYGCINLSLGRINQKNLHCSHKNPSKIKSSGKNSKLSNKRSGIIPIIANFHSKNWAFSRRSEKLLQTIFTMVDVKPSFNHNLIKKIILHLLVRILLYIIILSTMILKFAIVTIIAFTIVNVL